MNETETPLMNTASIKERNVPSPPILLPFNQEAGREKESHGLSIISPYKQRCSLKSESKWLYHGIGEKGGTTRTFNKLHERS